MEELFKRKLALLNEILEETKATVFVGDDNDALRYINLMEKREGIFAKIYELDKEIGKTPCSDKHTSETIAKTVSEIMKLDEKAAPYAQKARDSLKGNMKDLKTAKNLNTGYSQKFLENTGSVFDASN